MKYLYILLILFFCLPEFSFAQEPEYYFKNYQVSQGLSSNTVTAVTQDKKGFMWFGTRNGLNRFDGTAFKVYRNIPGDSSSIGSNSILSLNENEQSELWVGTYKGIYIYNPVKDTFTHLKGIPEGEVRFIATDKFKQTWIICNYQLFKYDPVTKKIISFEFKYDASLSLHISEKGTVWIATTERVIKRYNPANKTFQTYTLPALPGGKRLSAINALYALGDTALVLGTIRQILSFNLKQNSVTDIGAKNKLGTVHVHSISAQSSSELWLGSEAGLFILNIKNNQTSLVTKEYNNPYSITDNIVAAIYKDKEGGTWIVTYFGGINYYSRQFNNFQKYYPEIGKNSISGNLVHEICKDQYGNLWIGTEDAGLNKMNLTTGKITSFPADGRKGSLSYHNIHGLIADGNELWIGTFEHGLDVMDIRTGKVIRHYETGPAANRFKSDFIVTLYRTDNGDILVGTWNGLFRYNRKTDDFSPVEGQNSHIQSIHEDKKGTLWIGTYGDGIYSYPKNGEKKHLSAGINKYVNNLFEDSKGKFWFCTEGGLFNYNPSDSKVTSYTVKEGLPNNQIFRIQEDENGLFWISTGKGLCRFNPRSKEFQSFYTTHGLPTEQFNYNSSFRNNDGRLFFGTLKGMISFNPGDFIKNNFIPPVYITNLQVNNTDVLTGVNSILKEDILYADQLSLPYNESNLNFDVAALSYVNPEMNNYKYKMIGIDQQWTELKNNRRIFYNKLPPGNYTFLVQGSNNEGTYNQKITKLNISIGAPWWATYYAYIIYFLLSFGVIFTIFTYYRAALNEKNKRKIEAIERTRERDIYSAKIDFFTNVAHEIRTPLTLIKMPLDKLLKDHNSDQKLNDSLIMMNKNTNRLIELTNELLDFRKAEASNFSLSFTKNDVNESLTELYTTFKPAAEQKSLHYTIELPRITLHAFVDTEAFKKIISNLINNAVKYSSTKMSIKLLAFSSEDELFHIECRNDGNIIGAQFGEKIFEPFYRLEGDHAEQGTGIGLSLARSLAELHKGTLELKKGADKDENVFLLSLPIHQDYEINLVSNDPAENDKTTIETENQSENIHTESRKPGILIVEDNKDIRDYLTRELSDDYQILRATNGMEALDLLQKDHIQLVISDIMMPVMDGVQLCKKMKTDFQYSHIPIILLTAKTSMNSKIEGLEAGADAYIEKPFSFEHLHAQISNLLTNRNIIKDYFAKSPLTHIKGIAYAKADKDFLEKLNTTIYDHITDLNLDVDQLSYMMNMSKATLYRKIKGLSNLTPNELINLTRLKKAAELLASSEYKINEVANLVGYSVPSNFSRDFQKQFGMSPTNYLSKLKEENG